MVEYIEREAVCYQLAKQATIDGQPRAIRRATKIVAGFPAADVRPVVRGHWVRKDSIAHGRVMRVCLCSACKRNALINEDGFWELSNFCPNCGADMRGGKDERTD